MVLFTIISSEYVKLILKQSGSMVFNLWRLYDLPIIIQLIWFNCLLIRLNIII